ncbi:MAG: LmbE family protein, partial [Bacteroidota bacterium]
KSNTEVAAESRSMHKCQGFGSVGTRGPEMEYLELLKGEMPTNKTDIFEGINTTWTRVKGGAPIGTLLKKVEDNYQHDNPAASIADLAKAYQMIKALPDGYWKRVKQAEIEKVIQACAGLYTEAVADDYSATPGESVELTVEIINRSPAKVQLKTIDFLPVDQDTAFNMALENNTVLRFSKPITLPKDIDFTSPYWLNKQWELGMYTVEDQLMRGVPTTPRSFKVQYQIEVEGVPMTISKDVVYKRRDPVKGEVWRPFEVTPKIFANIESPVYVLADDAPKMVKVLLKSGKADVAGKVTLAHPNGWRIEPEFIDFSLSLKGEEKNVEFML